MYVVWGWGHFRVWGSPVSFTKERGCLVRVNNNRSFRSVLSLTGQFNFVPLTFTLVSTSFAFLTLRHKMNFPIKIPFRRIATNSV